MDFSVEFLTKSYQNKWIVSTKTLVIQGMESLEAEMQEGSGSGGAVVCHPHPLYGGSMDNNVVEAIVDGFHQAGFTTVRFNFRGVGRSTGRYGEGDGETEDVISACRFLKDHLANPARFVLAGYSFGAWVSARALGSVPFLTDAFLVAFPFSMGGVEAIKVFPGRIQLVGGSRDDISPVDDLIALHKGLPGEKHLKIIPTSHFFQGREDEISEFILEVFRKKEA